MLPETAVIACGIAPVRTGSVTLLSILELIALRGGNCDGRGGRPPHGHRLALRPELLQQLADLQADWHRMGLRPEPSAARSALSARGLV
jgi:hypothetical protein